MLMLTSICADHVWCQAASPCAQSPAQFLQQHAAERAARRRHAAAVQLQRFWRGVVAAAASTRQLAVAFAATGLPQGDSKPAADAAAWADAPQQVLVHVQLQWFVVCLMLQPVACCLVDPGFGS
jgi:hypothetical protein